MCNKLKIKLNRNIKHTPCCLDGNDSKYLQIWQLKNKAEKEEKITFKFKSTGNLMLTTTGRREEGKSSEGMAEIMPSWQQKIGYVVLSLELVIKFILRAF